MIRKYHLLIFFLFTLILLKTTGEATGAILINEILTSNTSVNLGENKAGFFDWIELYNSGTEPVDLGDYFISDDLNQKYKWPVPEGIVIEAKGYLVFYANGEDEDETHETNFKLKKSDGVVGIWDHDGQLADSLAYGDQESDVSYGRKPDGGEALYYFSEPTPGRANTGVGTIGAISAGKPVFSSEGGFYSGSLTVTLSTDEDEGIIRYTLDGSKPRSDSAIFPAALNISANTVVRARVFKTGLLPGPTVTNTYFINETTTLPVISLATDPDYFFDDEIGIYVTGHGDDPVDCFEVDCNYTHDWERPISVEMFDPDGNPEFKLDAGVTLHGRYSRHYDQKSLYIRARSKYGQSVISYKFFPDSPYEKYRSFLLRNSGSDWDSTLFRDAMAQELLQGQVGLATQDYRPAIVFINGEYWGIHNIREKMDEDYVWTHYGYDQDSIDLLSGNMEVRAGDKVQYQNLWDFMEVNDLGIAANYEYVQSIMDIENFLNYQVARIYYADRDWPHNNTKYWRPRTDDGKFQWLIYDTDLSFRYLWSCDHTWNSLEFATDPGGYEGSYPWATFLLRRLLTNQDFSNDFVQRFCSFINIVFAPDRVLAKIGTIEQGISAEMPRHLERWFGYDSTEAMDFWEGETGYVREFASLRPASMLEIINDYFGLDGTVELTLTVNGSQGGQIYLNGVPSPEGGFTGDYFKGIPLKLKAVARAGYKFNGWSGLASGTDEEITVVLTENSSIVAGFEADEAVVLVINEIHYNPSSSQGSDDDYEFIEVLNAGKNTMDLSGYAFTDGILFTFPQGSSIAPGEYLVVAKNGATYSDKGYQVFEWSSDLNLSNDGETITLINSLEEEIDQVTYNDKDPWPEAPDGDGPSLELKDPSLPNNEGSNWKSSHRVGGTPGRANSKADFQATLNFLDLLLGD